MCWQQAFLMVFYSDATTSNIISKAMFSGNYNLHIRYKIEMSQQHSAVCLTLLNGLNLCQETCNFTKYNQFSKYRLPQRGRCVLYIWFVATFYKCVYISKKKVVYCWDHIILLSNTEVWWLLMCRISFWYTSVLNCKSQMRAAIVKWSLKQRHWH